MAWGIQGGSMMAPGLSPPNPETVLRAEHRVVGMAIGGLYRDTLGSPWILHETRAYFRGLSQSDNES
jgi:hypothetical protein